MPDWKEIVREQMAAAGSAREIEPEVVAELAAHLADDYEEAIAGGLAECEAERRALAEIPWLRLARRIHRIRQDEKKLDKATLDTSEPGRRTMTQRNKKLWLPALASIAFTAVLLIVFDRIHAGPLAVGLGHLAMALQLAWFAAMPLIGKTGPEEALMNQRTRSIWMPGFVSLTAAGLIWFAEEIVLTHDASFYFTDLSLRPSRLISGLPFWFYFGWLLTQVLCGALGAFLSRRAGGSRAARMVAGAFPAIVMFGLCAVVIPVSALFEHKTFVLDHPGLLALGILIWAAAPAVALLLGAAPFLVEERHLSAA